VSVLEIPAQQTVKLRLEDGGREHTAQVMDTDEEALVVRVGAELRGQQPDGPVSLMFTANQFYWRAPVTVQAVYNGWWFLDRPTEAGSERVQRRTFVRILFEGSAVAMPVTPMGEPAGDLTTLHLTNLSADGCLAHSQTSFGLGDYVLVFLSIPELPTTSVISRIMRVQKLPSGDHLYGVRFESLSQTYQEQVAQFIAAEIQRHLELGMDITQPGG
jgi:c-di-GMP-binding flagellar brake protein YcgR